MKLGKIKIFILAVAAALSLGMSISAFAVGQVRNDSSEETRPTYVEGGGYLADLFDISVNNAENTRVTLTENQKIPDYYYYDFVRDDRGMTISEDRTVESNFYYNRYDKSTATEVYAELGKDEPFGMGVRISGVNSVLTDEAVELTLKNPIFLADNDITSSFVEFLATPEQYVSLKTTATASDYEFGRFYVKLTDVNDPEVYVKTEIKYSPYNTEQAYVEVSTATMQRAGLFKSETMTSEDQMVRGCGQGTGVKGGFCGTSKYSTAFYFDYDNNTVYTSKAYYDSNDFYRSDVADVRDLDDRTNLYYDTDMLFGGFSGKYAYVTIGITDFSGQEANLIVRSIDGQTLLTENGVIKKDKAPSLTFAEQFETIVPVGEVGKAYPIIPCQTYDFLGGAGITVSNSVCYDGKDIPIEDGAFVPEEVGYYDIEYIARDEYGNESAPKTISVYVSYFVPSLRLEFADGNPQNAMSVSVGERIAMPQATVAGGSGAFEYSTYIKNADSGEKISAGGTFVATEPGYYDYVYEATDYLGMSVKYVVKMTVTISETPVFEEIYMPEYIVAGKPFEVPAAIAYDYFSYAGAVEHAETEAEIYYAGMKDGAPYESTAFEKVEGSFVPAIDSGTIILRYTAKAILDSEKLSRKEYNLTVIDASPEKDLQKYFVYKEDEIKQGLGEADEFGAMEYAFMPMKNGASITFVNAISAAYENFGFTLHFADAVSAIKKFSVTLRDSFAINEKVTFTFEAGEYGRAKVYFNSKSYTAVVDGYGLYGSGSIRFELAENDTVRIGGTGVDAIAQYDGGDAFKGFSSGKVYVSFVFDESELSYASKGVRFRDFFGQPMFYKTTFGTDICDLNGPSIAVNGEIASNFKQGAEVSLPSASAFDLFDGQMPCSVRVEAPSGASVFTAEDAAESKLLRLDEIGTYRVTYSSVDTSGNPGERTFYIRSRDTVAPTLHIKEQYKSSAEKGDIIKIVAAEARDNYDDADSLTVYVVMYSPNGMLSTIAAYSSSEAVEAEYTFTEVGEYTIKYFTADSWGNYCVNEFTVFVRGES